MDLCVPFLVKVVVFIVFKDRQITCVLDQMTLNSHQTEKLILDGQCSAQV